MWLLANRKQDNTWNDWQQNLLYLGSDDTTMSKTKERVLIMAGEALQSVIGGQNLATIMLIWVSPLKGILSEGLIMKKAIIQKIVNGFLIKSKWSIQGEITFFIFAVKEEQ